MANRLTRKRVSELLTAYYRDKFRNYGTYTGTVYVLFDDSRRSYCLRGEGLAPHPDLAATYPNGWSLLDFIPPARARIMAQFIIALEVTK